MDISRNVLRAPVQVRILMLLVVGRGSLQPVLFAVVIGEANRDVEDDMLLRTSVPGASQVALVVKNLM